MWSMGVLVGGPATVLFVAVSIMLIVLGRRSARSNDGDSTGFFTTKAVDGKIMLWFYGTRCL